MQPIPSSRPVVKDEGPLGSGEVLVPPGLEAEFEKRLAALNKKAAAFGLPALRVLEQKDAFYQRRSEELGEDGDSTLMYLVPARPGDAHVVRLLRIQLEYPIVKLGNWQVVGKLDALPGGNVVFCVTQLKKDVQALADRSKAPITCEHCQKKRSRATSYLLRDVDSGAYMQVGKSCLKDFTGVDPAVALFLAQMSTVVTWADGDADELVASGRSNTVNTLEFLANVSFCISKDGFVSSRLARESNMQPTYDAAVSLPRECARSRELSQRFQEQREEHLACARETLNWYAAKEGADGFDRNVQLLLEGEHLGRDPKHLAIAAAGVSSYLSRPVELGLPAGTAHLGTVGQFMECRLTIQRIFPRNSPYGLMHMVTLRDPQGNSLIWSVSACPKDILRGGLGRSVQARFKVKKHEKYLGEPQTSVSHLKVQAWLDADQGASSAKTQA